jgi:hypothetical protein
MTILPGLMVAATPFLVVGGLLWLARGLSRRREARLARQIALTDAIHRELGAAAAPEVQQGWTGAWTVKMAVPLERAALVGALTRITHEFFARLDGPEPPRLTVLLSRQEPRPRRVVPRPAAGGAWGAPRRPARLIAR